MPALDGLRAVAVLLVMGYHAKLPGLHGGSAGVDIFFVLSGFLITALLIDEHARTGAIRLGGFYMRRVLRLYPALLVAITVAVVLAALKIPVFGAGHRSLRTTLQAVPFTLFYTVNVARAAGWTGGGFLAHAWSLAIEEQFYLVWPLVVMLALRRRARPIVLGGVALACAVASAGVRTALHRAGVPHRVVFNSTFTHVDGIFAGCALAVAWSMGAQIVDHLAHPVLTVGAAMALVAVVVMGGDRSMDSYGIFVAVVATVVVLASLLHHPESALGRALSQPTMAALGRRSYGVYLFHWPIFQFLGVSGPSPVRLLLGFAASFAAAWLSFRVVEVRFLRMKKRWTYRGHPPTDLPEARSAPAVG